MYHDTAGASGSEGESDVNVYLRNMAICHGKWELSTPTKINDDPVEGFEKDQFLPCHVVDPSGFSHIAFYDDRNYNLTSDQKDGQTDPPPKFDVYYMRPWSGIDNLELFAEPAEPALDWQWRHVDPHKYIGIAWLNETAWTVYTGTKVLDLPDRAVISSNRIEWSSPP